MPSRPGRKDARFARDVLERLQEIHQIIALAPLDLVFLGSRPDTMVLGHGVRRGMALPIPLTNGAHPNVRMHFQFVRDYLKTLEASFTYQTSATIDDPEWVFRYDYKREPSFDENGLPYPRSHLHVNATSIVDQNPYPLKDFHLPTRRVTLEQVVWHLIQEHGVEPNKDDWKQILWRNEENCRDIQHDRNWPYDPPFGWQEDTE